MPKITHRPSTIPVAKAAIIVSSSKRDKNIEIMITVTYQDRLVGQKSALRPQHLVPGYL